MHFLKLKHTHREVLAKKWSQFTIWKSGPEENTDAVEDAPATKKVKIQPSDGKATKKTSEANEKGGSRASSGSGNNKGTSPAKPIGNILFEVMKIATQSKTNTNKALQKGEQLRDQIGVNSELGWANNDENLGVLNALIKAVRDEQSSFSNEFLLAEVAQIRKKFTDAQLKEHFQEFVKLVKYKELEKFTKKTMRRHNA